MHLTPEIERRFWAKVAQLDQRSCWIWQGTITSDGYGQFRCGARVQLAHRVVYTIHHRTSVDDLVVRHKCDNRACCNPSHLDVGTHADNVADRQSRNRQAAGARNGRAKLTPELVAAVRASKLTDLEVAVRLRIDQTTVRKIRAGKIWAGASMGRVWEERAEVPFVRRRK